MHALPSVRRRGPLALLLVLALLVIAACDPQYESPPADAPPRYRDDVWSQVIRWADTAYGSAVNEQGQTQTLSFDFYEPNGDAAPARPAVILVHGGGFRGGDKTSPELVDEANYLARKGYIVFSINYRLSATGCVPVGPNCLTAILNAKHDALAMVRFLRANSSLYRVDTNRIAISGSSAGAITALNVAYGSEDAGNSGNPGFPSDVRAAVSLSGARIGTTPGPGDPTVLLIHGTADPLVPYQSAVNTKAAAEAAGLTAYLTAFQDAGHVPYVGHRDIIVTQMRNFLYWTLDLQHAAQ